MAIDVVAAKLEQANEIKKQIRAAANTKDISIPEDAPFADYPGYIDTIRGHLQEKTLIPTAEGVDALPDEEYDGFSRVQIPAEPNFIPANIGKGITLWGLTGTKGVIITSGTFTGTGSTVTISHNLGVIPDCVIVMREENLTISTSAGNPQKAVMLIGFSSRFISAHPELKAQKTVSVANGYCYANNYASPIDKYSAYNPYLVQSANAVTFDVGSSSYMTWSSGDVFRWIAFGQLI